MPAKKKQPAATSEPVPVRLADIAREVGLSRSGVSRALRNDPSIPLATCRDVQKVARKSLAQIELSAPRQRVAKVPVRSREVARIDVLQPGRDRVQNRIEGTSSEPRRAQCFVHFLHDVLRVCVDRLPFTEREGTEVTLRQILVRDLGEQYGNDRKRGPIEGRAPLEDRRFLKHPG